MTKLKRKIENYVKEINKKLLDLGPLFNYKNKNKYLWK